VALPSTADPLLILAMDHRESFARQFGVGSADATPEQREQMQAAKLLIYRGAREARDQLTAGQVGVLVDEELGADVLRAARADGLTVAMPVEKSGQKLFALQYGEQTAEHIAAFDPAYVKVLVRMNPDDAAADTAAQLAALADLSALLHREQRALLYELLVPATEQQLGHAGDQETYDREIRPDLVARVIDANQRAGVEPALWKIEGLETTAAAQHIVTAARSGGRSADCIVLGRDAPRPVLDRWLAVAAPVPGFVGFAVGRSIWEDPLALHRQQPDDDRLVEAVRANFLHFAHAYLDAR
jgi:myo-inositol catabolism protein IolC